MPLSVFTFRWFICQRYKEPDRQQTCRDKQRLRFKNLKYIGSDEASGAPCGKHKTIYFSDISRTERISRECRHSGETTTVAGQKIAGYDHEKIVACHITFGYE